MSDLIDRQTAISAICNACGKIDCDKMDKCEKLQLPPANSSEFPNSSDCISRQAAIDAADRADYTLLAIEDVKLVTDEVVKEIKKLPSAQPEIIRCKDCKYHGANECNHSFALVVSKDNDFCSYAERRTDADA